MRLVTTLALGLFLGTAVAASDVYSTEPVRLIVPFLPGGATTSWGT